MHKNKLNIICFGNDDFNNTLNELKAFFDYDLSFFKSNEKNITQVSDSLALIHYESLSNDEIVKFLNNTNLPKVLLSKKELKVKTKFDENIKLPINFHNLKQILNDVGVRKKYAKNSSIEVKQYILNKNQKKLKVDNLFVDVTEKEINLIELLYKTNVPLKKNVIQKTVWKYSSDADTHTVETHIYRLRKKVTDKFKDTQFIQNNKDGYFI